MQIVVLSGLTIFIVIFQDPGSGGVWVVCACNHLTGLYFEPRRKEYLILHLLFFREEQKAVQ